MRLPQLVLMTVALSVSCGEDKTTSKEKTSAPDNPMIDEDDGVEAGGTSFESGGEGEGEGEGEGSIGDQGLPGDPAEGEAFQFVVELDCDYRWDLAGEIVSCDDCELAFELTLERSTSGSCTGGENGSGTLVVRNVGVYFEGRYWGTVFAAGGGYLTWNTLGYVYGDRTYYYLGHLSY